MAWVKYIISNPTHATPKNYFLTGVHFFGNSDHPVLNGAMTHAYVVLDPHRE
jgi:hypothetical protein